MTPQPLPSGEAAREVGLAPPQPPSGRWRHLIGLLGDYWLSPGWKFAWAGLAVLLIYQFGNVYLMVASNRWQQAFYDSIEQRQASRFYPLLLAFVAIMGGQIGATLVNSYVGRMLGLEWRTALTRRYLDRWLARDRYIEIERLRLIDNPDQRIADDINLVTGPAGVLTIALNLLGMVVGAISFAMILLETAPPIHLGTLSVPGSTVWYACAYALVGTAVMAWIGAPYIRASMRQQHYEADFRAGLIHVRRNAAQIGFAGALPTERASVDGNFTAVRRNYVTVILTTLGLNVGQGIYERIGSILPLFLMVPRYFAGAISFGQVMGARDAFQSMVGQLSYIVQAYAQIGTLVACLNRLKALDDVMDRERPRGIALVEAPGDAVLATRGLAIHRPNGAPLLAVEDWTIRGGERWVVQGPSGTGKSTLLRAIVGQWPDGAGDVARARSLATMVVPQRLYLPLGTLKSAICFPDGDAAHDDADIVTLLDSVGLEAHRDHLHAVRFWQEELSPGEQQRVALARILLHRPDVLILDEATSALDPDNARRFYEQLLAALPGLTLVSVVHDDRLARHHTHRLTVAGNGATASAIEDDR